MPQHSQIIAEDPRSSLEIAEAMANELEQYIIKDELYRTVLMHTAHGNERVTMTGGDLLTRVYQLTGERDQLSADLQARVDALEERVNTTIYSLKTRFHERLLREMKARLDSLKWYLDDCASDPGKCRANFPFEMRNRQRIEEILKQVDDDVSEQLRAGLRSVDQRIRQLTHGTGFIWDKRLQPVYPSSPYWYLYVSP